MSKHELEGIAMNQLPLEQEGIEDFRFSTERLRASISCNFDLYILLNSDVKPQTRLIHIIEFRCKATNSIIKSLIKT